MSALVLPGRILIGLAMLSFLGELAVRAFVGAAGYVSAEELWVSLAPDSYAAMRAWFRQGLLPLWSYGVGPVLKLPAWGLFGGPGVALLWAAGRGETADEVARAAEAAFLYDELEKRAKEEGFDEESDRPTADGGSDIIAAAKEAEAELARDPLFHPENEATNEGEKTPPIRPPS
ncbi:MAG: hypothetical protein FJX42_05145 [Alphaproteobacteria bacterium]|nr:hypothetical protein [Alphaproteobacteria bacterium]